MVRNTLLILIAGILIWLLAYIILALSSGVVMD
jgi:hypothetical protein